jgi:hypothetical protein
MRFSIRDLLWATLVVATGLGWWVSYRDVKAKQIDAVQQTGRHRAALKKAKEWISPEPTQLTTRLTAVTVFNMMPDWGVLDEPLVEP